MTPRVSVVIPCYDAARFVADAVASVLAQGRPDVEILVVDDGSSDRSALEEALRPFGAAVTRLEGPHGGPAAARNRGIAAARGPYLAFLDADDVWLPGFLERQLALLERTGADLVYCDADFFGTQAAEGRSMMQELPSRGDVTLGAVLAGRCVVVMSTIVARADRIRAAGGFDAARGLCEDLDLWVRMLEDGARFAYDTTQGARRRIHAHNLSHQGDRMLDEAIAVVARHAASPRLGAEERTQVARRLLRMRGERQLYAAKQAIRDGDARAARRALWGSLRGWPQWKSLVGAVALTVAPAPAMRYLRRHLA